MNEERKGIRRFFIFLKGKYNLGREGWGKVVVRRWGLSVRFIFLIIVKIYLIVDVIVGKVDIRYGFVDNMIFLCF